MLDALLVVVVGLRYGRVGLVRAGRRDALVLEVNPGGGVEGLFERRGADERRGSPDFIDFLHLFRNIDEALGRTEDFMLNIGGLNEGFVLDHIEAGKAMMIYNNLGLDKLDCCVAIIKNARSNKMGKKDIIKIEGGLDLVDLDVLGFIDHNITVNIIKDGKIVEKKRLSLPKKITNVIKCKNPRCITSIEQELKHIFILTDEENQVYRCKYCEEKYTR